MKQFSYNSSKTTLWSGGKTTELFISPSSSEFSDKNFDIRISSATVESPETTFTDFTGYKRYLLILSGEFELRHVGKYIKKLGRFEEDFFDGSWTTEGKGIVQDFNIIYNPKYSLECSLKTITKDTTIFAANETHFVFILENSCLINNVETQALDLIQIEEHILLQPVQQCKYLEIRLKLV
jgi:environmental stress-induced protein Ves